MELKWFSFSVSASINYWPMKNILSPCLNITKTTVSLQTCAIAVVLKAEVIVHLPTRKIPVCTFSSLYTSLAFMGSKKYLIRGHKTA